MTTELLPPPTEEIELWEVDFDSDIECEFMVPPKMEKCTKIATCRIKVICIRCDHHAIMWTCDEHLDFLKNGKIYCSICSMSTRTWEIIS